jgi:hypothetical protein
MCCWLMLRKYLNEYMNARCVVIIELWKNYVKITNFELICAIFVPFWMTKLWSILRYTVSDYHFDIFKHFVMNMVYLVI